MNSELQPYFEKAALSLDAARLLLSKGYYDISASRAYYSMFYVAEALLSSRGQSYSSHSAVIGSFGREFAKTGAMDPKYHRWLMDAHDYRSTADYIHTQKINEAQALAACSWAEEFLARAQEFLTPK